MTDYDFLTLEQQVALEISVKKAIPMEVAITEAEELLNFKMKGNTKKGEENLILVSYFEEFGRLGELEGIFLCTEEELSRLKGVTVEFGEVLGKHSEISSEMTFNNSTVIDTTEEDIAALLRIFAGEGSVTISGFNPLEYLGQDEEE